MASSIHLPELVDREAGHVRFLRADKDTQATTGRGGRDSEPSFAGHSATEDQSLQQCWPFAGRALTPVLSHRLCTFVKALQILLVVFPGQIAGASSRDQRLPFICESCTTVKRRPRFWRTWLRPYTKAPAYLGCAGYATPGCVPRPPTTRSPLWLLCERVWETQPCFGTLSLWPLQIRAAKSFEQ